MWLTSVLPGFRQLRAALAAGYLWLLFIYLVADLGAVNPTSGIVKQIADLASAMSPVGVAVAVSFAASLVGSFSNEVGGELAQLLYRMGNPRSPYRQGLSAQGFAALDDLLAPRVATLADAGSLGRDVLRELDLVKTRLLATEPELHAEIDRLHAEADFRFALLLPLTAVSIVGVLEIPPDGVASLFSFPPGAARFLMIIIALYLILLFAVQAVGVWRQANDKLVDAVFLERVQSPALERWDREAAAG